MKKDNLTDITENLQSEDKGSEGLRDESGNQQVTNSDGEVITLGENDVKN